MSIRAIPRSAVDGAVKLTRMPLDIVVSLLPGDSSRGGPGPSAGIALDRLDATVRDVAGMALGDSEMRADAERRRNAADERARALRQRDDADGTGSTRAHPRDSPRGDEIKDSPDDAENHGGLATDHGDETEDHAGAAENRGDEAEDHVAKSHGDEAKSHGDKAEDHGHAANDRDGGAEQPTEDEHAGAEHPKVERRSTTSGTEQPRAAASRRVRTRTAAVTKEDAEKTRLEQLEAEAKALEEREAALTAQAEARRLQDEGAKT